MKIEPTTYKVILEVDEEYLKNEHQSTLETELEWINCEGIVVKQVERIENDAEKEK